MDWLNLFAPAINKCVNSVGESAAVLLIMIINTIKVRSKNNNNIHVFLPTAQILPTALINNSFDFNLESFIRECYKYTVNRGLVIDP